MAESKTAKATFLAKSNGILAGVWVAHAVFHLVDPTVSLSWSIGDGQAVITGQHIGVATGSARSILIAERLALNFMQRMSGIATLTSKMAAAAARGGGSAVTVLDTRKTVPGLRLVDKWAVKIGGGGNHRIGLYDMVMIKDNHIAAAGGKIALAVDRAHAYMKEKEIQRPVEVETRTLEELQQVLDIIDNSEDKLIDRIMLDNMTRRITHDNNNGGGDNASLSIIDVSTLAAAMELIGDRRNTLETEASGNVMLDTIEDIAKTGVKYISCGALTHSVTALDISLNIEV